MNGTPNHVLVNKVLDYDPDEFNTYTMWVYVEQERRGFKCRWDRFEQFRELKQIIMPKEILFDGWHNDRYLRQCLMNLQEKADCGAIPAEEWLRITEQWPEYR